MKRINIGLIGFGVVGTGVYRILLENSPLIQERLGGELIVNGISVRDLKGERGVEFDRALLTTDPFKIVNNPETDIVIELMGGCDPALDLVLTAVKNGKHVVTANKALLAIHGREIFSACNTYGVDLGYEASVGGGIPVIRTMREGFAANRFKSLYGILNGTCNYILSRMSEEGTPFAEVLKDAQAKGYAEADPTFDIEGTDTAHKIAILASIAFGGFVRFEDIHTEGISEITPVDLEFAKEFGYRIKLLALAKEVGELVDIRVHPTMVQEKSPISSINGVLNAVGIVGDMVQESLLVGAGAGSLPTASAVAGDIIEVARNMIYGGAGRLNSASGSLEGGTENIKIKKIDEVESKYYLRFRVSDRPNVLSQISGIFGNCSISIGSVIQKGRNENGSVPLVIMTHRAVEKNIKKAVSQISTLDVVCGKPVLIRVEKDI
ncbi:MAG: homoserine dehydrogenase [Nitrospinota bacterium]